MVGLLLPKTLTYHPRGDETKEWATPLPKLNKNRVALAKYAYTKTAIRIFQMLENVENSKASSSNKLQDLTAIFIGIFQNPNLTGPELTNMWTMLGWEPEYMLPTLLETGIPWKATPLDIMIETIHKFLNVANLETAKKYAKIITEYPHWNSENINILSNYPNVEKAVMQNINFPEELKVMIKLLSI